MRATIGTIPDAASATATRDLAGLVELSALKRVGERRLRVIIWRSSPAPAKLLDGTLRCASCAQRSFSVFIALQMPASRGNFSGPEKFIDPRHN